MSGEVPNTPIGAAETTAEVQARAEALGLVPFFAQDEELFIDLDKTSCKGFNVAVRDLLEKAIPIVGSLSTTSHHGGSHFYIRLKWAPDHTAKLAFQAALGSDPVRETIMAVRASAGWDSMNVLFETPEQAKRVEEWRKELFL